MASKNSTVLVNGIKDGIPIGLGYFAVAFSFGIVAHNAGVTAFQGFMMSALNMASAGQYAGLAAFQSGAPMWELCILMLIVNARYLLMSCALSQKMAPELSLGHRLFVGYGITDEIFGISILRPYPMNPYYNYGAFISTVPMWSSGTAAGIIAGNLLPPTLGTALGAAIYGMFIAVVVPQARQNKAVFVVVLVSFAVSTIAAFLPFMQGMTESFRIIILTLVISVAAAIIHPQKEELAPDEAACETAATDAVCEAAVCDDAAECDARDTHTEAADNAVEGGDE